MARGMLLDPLHMLDQESALYSAPDKVGGRVMVVEDEPEVAELAGRILRGSGHEVKVITDSRQALEAASDFRPDLVTIDVLMPSVDGISLCLQLRRNSDVPLLFVSAKDEAPDRVVGLGIRADDYLGKPSDTHELVARAEA